MVAGRPEGWVVGVSEYLPVFTSREGEREVAAAYQSVLDAWPVPFAAADVPTSLGITRVIASGPDDAPVIVLLHAYFATALSWYRNVGALSRRHRVLAVDVIGEANASRPTRPIRSLDDSTRWFEELLDGLGVERASLVGNSFGGFLAANYAQRLPDRVDALVLIGPAATFHRIPAFYLHLFLPKALCLLLPWLPGKEWAIDRSVTWLRAGLPPDSKWEALFRAAMLHGNPQVRLFPRVFTHAELAQITAPTLLILGERENVYRPDAAAASAKRLMPDIQIQTIPQANHIAALSQPDLVDQVVLGFLARAASH